MSKRSKQGKSGGGSGNRPGRRNSQSDIVRPENATDSAPVAESTHAVDAGGTAAEVDPNQTQDISAEAAALLAEIHASQVRVTEIGEVPTSIDDVLLADAHVFQNPSTDESAEDLYSAPAALRTVGSAASDIGEQSESDSEPFATDSDDDSDDYTLGGEASPPPGTYPRMDGPTATDRVRTMRESATDEVRELERRARANASPAFPIEFYRKLPLEFLWKRWRDLAMRDRSDVVDEFGRDPIFATKIDPAMDFLYSKYFRVELEGLENLPSTGRALLVANHSGGLPYDGAMLMHGIRKLHPSHRAVRPLVEDFVFHFPYLGTFINRIGGVRACQENAERLLQQGECVAVFPEGIKGIGKLFRERYRLQRFGRGGFVKLALRTDAPILPVAIVGAEEIHPMIGKLTWFSRPLKIPYIPITPTFPWLGPLGAVPLPTKWKIRIGAPLAYHAEFGNQGAEDRILVNRLSENVRTNIQEMIDEMTAARGSVFGG